MNHNGNVIFYLIFKKNQFEWLSPQAVTNGRTLLLFVFFGSSFKALQGSMQTL